MVHCASIISTFYDALLHLFCCVASKAPSWTHARINSFLHRNRRNQSVDEVCAELLIHEFLSVLIIFTYFSCYSVF
jgi:hypothetical protein